MAQRGKPTGMVGQGAFAAPMRTITRFSDRYSRTVQALKVILPLIALAVVGLMAAWPALVVSNGPLISKQDVAQLMMRQARFYSVDKNDRPFSILADSTVKSTSERGVIELVNPNAEMTLTGGAWITVDAKHGVYNENTKKLFLTGQVHLMHEGGFEFTTEEAHVDTGNSTAWGNKHIVGQGPFGELDAQGFQIFDRGQKVVFLGISALHLASGKSPS